MYGAGAGGGGTADFAAMMTSLGNGIIYIDMDAFNGFLSVVRHKISEYGIKRAESEGGVCDVWSFADHKRRRAMNTIIQYVLVIGYFVSKYGCVYIGMVCHAMPCLAVGYL